MSQYTAEQVEAEFNRLRTGEPALYTADMLRAYAATLKAAQGGVTEAMVERARLAIMASDGFEPGSDGYINDSAIRAALEAALSAEPAAPHFPDANALADWLESLHECHTDGAVGNRKWEVAQIAAKVVRGPAQPAERVPGGMVLVPSEAGDTDAFMVLHEYQQPGRTRKDAYRIAIRKLAERASAMLAASPAPSEGGKGVEG